MNEYIRDLMEQYSKDEVIDLCGELDLTVADSTRFPDVVKLLLAELDENGVPENADCSELMSDFIYVAEYVDEDGELVDIEEEAEEEKVVEVEEDNRIPKIVPDNPSIELDIDRLPECFGFHDARDPACRKCKIKVSCQDERTKTRPDCFGTLYDKNNIQCKQCIERTFCKEVLDG